MDNPNVASGKSSTPNMLDRIGNGFQMSNSNGISGAKYAFGSQSDVAGQASMVPNGGQPAFGKLAPRSIPTNPGPMGTDHKP